MPTEPYLIRPIPPGPSTAFAARGALAHPGGYQTWSMRPWWRRGGCAEVECMAWRRGWQTVIDETTAFGREQADYIRYHSGRRFTVGRDPTGLTVFDFYSGQTCFRPNSAEHVLQVDRAAVFVAQPGDWRAMAGRARVYDRVDQFADDLRTHHDKIATARSRAGTGN